MLALRTSEVGQAEAPLEFRVVVNSSKNVQVLLTRFKYICGLCSDSGK